MTLNVQPIDATLGARVTGVDLGSLDDATFAAIYQEFLKYGVLVFPGQHLSDEAQAQFAERFGEIERVSPNQTGGTMAISNHKPDGTVLTYVSQSANRDHRRTLSRRGEPLSNRRE